MLFQEIKLKIQNNSRSDFDRIELETYMIASALLAKKSITINKIDPKIVKSEISILKKIGIQIIRKKLQ